MPQTSAPVIRACAAVIIRDRILMVQHQQAGRTYWTLPGGGVEAGEAPEQAAERELFEETGLVGFVERPLFDEPFQAGVCRCFLMRIDPAQRATLGYDPEEAHLAIEHRMLREVGWQKLSAVADDRQVSQVMQALARA